MEKSDAAFRTIGEVSSDLGVPQHVLRYWETRFPQLRPVTRAGNRRYYRPADIVLARRIHVLLSQEGYTVRGVQKLLADKAANAVPPPTCDMPIAEVEPVIEELRAIRSLLAAALDADATA